MNSYKLNGMAGHYFRQTVCKHLKISHTEIYKTLEKIFLDNVGNVIIETKDGKKYRLTLTEHENTNQQ